MLGLGLLVGVVGLLLGLCVAPLRFLKGPSLSFSIHLSSLCSLTLTSSSTKPCLPRADVEVEDSIFVALVPFFSLTEWSP